MTVSYFDAANKLKQEGKFEEAIASYRSAIEENPKFYWSYHNLGEVLAKLGRWDEAVNAYSHAVELNPNAAWSYCNQGEAFVKLGRLDEAIACCERAIELAPDELEIQSGLGEALRQRTQRDIDRAIGMYQRAIELNPESVEAYQSLVQLQPDRWEIRWQLGNVLVKIGQTEEAIAAYQRAIELNPESVEAYQSLVQLQPDHWEIWWQLGNVLVKIGQTEEAIAAYQRVIELNPVCDKLTDLPADNWDLWWQLGQKLEQQGEIERAIDIYQKIILNLNAKAESNFQMGRSLAQNDRLEQAVHRYEEAISINPIWVKISAHLGNIFAGKKKYSQAIQSYERVIEIQPENQEALYQLVVLHRNNNNLEKAMIHSQRLIEINPNSPQYLFMIGNLSLTKGKRDEAMSYYHKASQIKCSKIKTTDKLMPILISSIPKSGTVYIEDSLRKGLKISSMRELKFIRTGASGAMDIHLELGFPEIYYSDVYGILVDHLNASEWNLLAINVMVDRLLVNVRDPRQGLISWISHFNRYSKIVAHQVELSRNFKYSEHYLRENQKEEIDYQIEHGFLPYTIKWIEGWLDAQENSLFKPKILFTKFEDLATNPNVFFKSILDFYGIEESKFTYPKPVEFKQGTHYRKGSVNEWQEVFTPEQKQKASSIIPKKILERFGWPQ
ncbi:tetratricopeptide repeat protein [Microcoleus sp. A006_D1]|uniref:tetratricopeptide repeat protein n=1 Tax=Microcoleus sp. A006_D1 TaxID=3055267 RepID=UPI002FD717C9